MQFDNLINSILLETTNTPSNLVTLLESIYPLSEAIQLAPVIQDVLDAYNIGGNKFNLIDDPTIKSINPSNIDGELSIEQNNNKIESRRIGKLLRKLIPSLTDRELTILAEDIRVAITIDKKYPNAKIEFKIDPDVYSFYENCPTGLGSCMTKKQRVPLIKNDWSGSYTPDFKADIVEFYKTQADNVKMLLLYINGKLSGRALLWNNVNNAKDGIFIDRTYPPENLDVKYFYTRYAIKNDWTYRLTNHIEKPTDIANTINGRNELEYQCINVEDIKYIPYMDTFRYGTADGEFTNLDGGNKQIFADSHGTKFGGDDVNDRYDLSDPEIINYLAELKIPLEEISYNEAEYYIPKEGVNIGAFICTNDANYNMQSLSIATHLHEDIKILVTNEDLEEYVLQTGMSSNGYDIDEVYYPLIKYLWRGQETNSKNRAVDFIRRHISDNFYNNMEKYSLNMLMKLFSALKDGFIGMGSEDSSNAVVLYEDILEVMVSSPNLDIEFSDDDGIINIIQIVTILNKLERQLDSTIQSEIVEYMLKIYLYTQDDFSKFMSMLKPLTNDFRNKLAKPAIKLIEDALNKDKKALADFRKTTNASL